MDNENINDTINKLPEVGLAKGLDQVLDQDLSVELEKNSSFETEIETIESWEDLNIKPEILRGIFSCAYEKPSPIQQKAIKPILDGRDILGQAQSGTGKTATFTIGILNKLDLTVNSTQAIIIAPTHELVNQISEVVKKLGSMMKGLVVKTLYGGTSVSEDARDLHANVPHVIVGCSGRIFDMIKRKHISMECIQMFALDEADEMLSHGFKDQIYNIFQYLNETVQVILFSATMPKDVLELSKKFMRNPVYITMKAETLNLECIRQFYIALPNDSLKYNTIKDLFSKISVGQCIVYVNSIKRVVDLFQAMVEEGFSVCNMHSSMTKEERDTAFKQFVSGEFRVLISSDITSRGIDIQQVSTVINFDIPKDVHTYLHRIGRGGRWGRKGTAINFVTRQDMPLLKSFEAYYNSSITEFQTDSV